MAPALGSYTRDASHCGSWYTNDPTQLQGQLGYWLTEASSSSSSQGPAPSLADFSEHNSSSARGGASTSSSSSTSVCMGIIAPHAGYSYSGPTAAYSYQHLLHALQNHTVERIVVLHPSHHVYLTAVAFTGAKEIQTTLGPIRCDVDFMRKVEQSTMEAGLPVTVMKKDVDEAEHSGEMQYPYIRYCLEKAGMLDIPIAVMMVGALPTQQEANFGKVLRKCFLEEETPKSSNSKSNFFVVSSDFCHWGQNFDYCPCPPQNYPGFQGRLGLRDLENWSKISQYVAELDSEGIDLICSQEPDAFVRYLRKTQNTICGRHPISLFLFVLDAATEKQDSGKGRSPFHVEFEHYEQSSSQVQSFCDSSVSYVAMKVSRQF
ncbi:unnamed protein product [Amoebophrya sp. A120]|nr:unnamed protein product [Amoebophrya sp. A120]|eukprot:GSA120T00018489001.1